MTRDGFYILVEQHALREPHMHFSTMVDVMEFLIDILGPDFHRANVEKCKRYSTFLGLPIESYCKNERIVYFTEDLFSADEASMFVRSYLADNFTGLNAQLAIRPHIDIKHFVRGRIALALSCEVAENGQLEIDFSALGRPSLGYLYEARMYYTAPIPGNFSRIDVDENGPKIRFYHHDFFR